MKRGEVTTRVRDRYTMEELDPNALDRFIDAAVRLYSRYNPEVKSTSFETVVDQQDYDLPADCALVIDTEYWPLGSLYTDREYPWLKQVENPYSYHQPSTRVIDDIERSTYAERLRGRWEKVGSQLRLWPTPAASGIEITVEYAAVHSLAMDEASSIPGEDMDLLVDLVLAEVFKARGGEVALEPDYAEGLQRTTKRFVPGNVRAVVRDLRQPLLDKYDGPVGR